MKDKGFIDLNDLTKLSNQLKKSTERDCYKRILRLLTSKKYNEVVNIMREKLKELD